MLLMKKQMRGTHAVTRVGAHRCFNVSWVKVSLSPAPFLKGFAAFTVQLAEPNPSLVQLPVGLSIFLSGPVTSPLLGWQPSKHNIPTHTHAHTLIWMCTKKADKSLHSLLCMRNIDCTKRLTELICALQKRRDSEWSIAIQDHCVT